MSLQDTWSAVLARVEERIGAQNHDIWIRPIRLLGLDGSTLRLQVPNRYYSDWVRDNYEKVLAEEASAAFGQSLNIRYQLADDPVPQAEPEAPATPDLPRRIGVMVDKKFDNYVVGACNQFAHAAAKGFSDFPDQSYNPLFIFGGTGLGKTHLVQAIGNRIHDQRNGRVFYTTAEDFVNEMIRALRFKRMDDFRARYRRAADVLIIDDIQFLSGKDRSQEEFFHTFEAMKNSGKQIVLTSDVLPREIDKLEPRLRTRFEGGLLADIQPPDMETMVAILHKKTDPLGMEVPDDVALWIASRVRGNIRELEGALNRLAALHRFFSEPLTVEFARKHLGQLLAEEPQALTPDKIIHMVARFFNIKVSDIKGRRKLKGVVRPRQIAMYLAREHTELSFPDLGRAFGGKDHSTVQHAYKKIGNDRKKDPDLQAHIETLERHLGA